MIGDLMKQATAHKRAGNWEEALRCSREAHNAMLASATGGFTVESWTKYPLYLQQAGRYEDAMAVFREILDAAEEIMAKELPSQPKFIQRGYAHNVRRVVFDKMRVAAQREKRADDADVFRQELCRAADAFEAFTKVRDLHLKREREKYERRRAERPA